MPTCSKCSEHLALLELAKVAMLVLADADQSDDYDYVRGKVSVDEKLMLRLHNAGDAFNAAS